MISSEVPPTMNCVDPPRNSNANTGSIPIMPSYDLPTAVNRVRKDRKQHPPLLRRLVLTFLLGLGFLGGVGIYVLTPAPEPQGPRNDSHLSKTGKAQVSGFMNPTPSNPRTHDPQDPTNLNLPLIPLRYSETNESLPRLPQDGLLFGSGATVHVLWQLTVPMDVAEPTVEQVGPLTW